jgi:short-subunit dehydrogenase
MSETRSQTPFRIPISSSTRFITGISRRLGRSIAEEVMQRGGRVAGTVRSLAHADELKKQFPDQLWVRETRLVRFDKYRDYLSRCRRALRPGTRARQ